MDYGMDLNPNFEVIDRCRAEPVRKHCRRHPGIRQSCRCSSGKIPARWYTGISALQTFCTVDNSQRRERTSSSQQNETTSATGR